jgi:hypothetical protein
LGLGLRQRLSLHAAVAMLLPEGELAELPSRWTSGMVRAPPIK